MLTPNLRRVPPARKSTAVCKPPANDYYAAKNHIANPRRHRTNHRTTCVLRHMALADMYFRTHQHRVSFPGKLFPEIVALALFLFSSYIQCVLGGVLDRARALRPACIPRQRPSHPAHYRSVGRHALGRGRRNLCLGFRGIFAVYLVPLPLICFPHGPRFWGFGVLGMDGLANSSLRHHEITNQVDLPLRRT